jgi:hypothetical protein
MEIEWSEWYRPAWDDQPEGYVEAGVVGWGRSRRLAKAQDSHADLKAYIGVQHNDPGRWNLAGDPSARFFLSIFIRGQTLTLRTYPTIAAALSALTTFRDAPRASRAQ